MSGSDFTAADLAQLAARSVSEREAQRQLDLLRHPPRAVVLDRPCTLGDGIIALSTAAQDEAYARGQRLVSAGRVMKFVPASGAATRMFQSLIAARRNAGRPSSSDAGRTFFEHLDEFPFAGELRQRSGIPGRPVSDADERALLATLLDAMGYAEMPKGLVEFHGDGRPHTAFEDQLEEGIHYTRSASGSSRMHFTVVPDRRKDVEQLLASLRPSLEVRHSCTLEVTFSEQLPSTDTLALDANARPFRTADGALLFRPAGHGALIDNLEAVGGDIVVIKNIDNVLPVTANAEVVRWKFVLLGVLAELEAERAEMVTKTEKATTAAELDALIEQIDRRFGRAPRPAASTEERRTFVADALRRPLRVCGVVRNDGEPGGAPFWVRSGDQSTKQIVESAQIDLTDSEQRRIFAAATHFNPVDIVCALRDASGGPLRLSDFVDAQAAFVARKVQDGRDLIALERPGLWNGAMAHWNTVNVEVPASTFAPVKTVFDLLRPEHR